MAPQPEADSSLRIEYDEIRARGTTSLAAGSCEAMEVVLAAPGLYTPRLGVAPDFPPLVQDASLTMALTTSGSWEEAMGASVSESKILYFQDKLVSAYCRGGKIFLNPLRVPGRV